MHQVFLAQSLTGTGRWDVTLSKGAKQQFLKNLGGNFIIFKNGHRYIGSAGRIIFKP